MVGLESPVLDQEQQHQQRTRAEDVAGPAGIVIVVIKVGVEMSTWT